MRMSELLSRSPVMYSVHESSSKPEGGGGGGGRLQKRFEKAQS